MSTTLWVFLCPSWFVCMFVCREEHQCLIGAEFRENRTCFQDLITLLSSQPIVPKSLKPQLSQSSSEYKFGGVKTLGIQNVLKVQKIFRRQERVQIFVLPSQYQKVKPQAPQNNLHFSLLTPDLNMGVYVCDILPSLRCK